LDHLLVLAGVSVDDPGLAESLYTKLVCFINDPETASSTNKEKIEEVVIDQFFRRFVVAWETPEWAPMVLALFNEVKAWNKGKGSVQLLNDLVRWSLSQNKESLVRLNWTDLQPFLR